MKTILAPIDFSDVSQRVMAEAVALCRAVGGRLVILHIVSPPLVTDSDAGMQMSADYSALAADAAEKQLERLRKPLVADGISVRAIHQVGFPGARIVEQAAKLSADYVVIGSHGHGAFYDLIVGSTTMRVIKQAKCPVLVVPAGTKARRKSKSKRR